MVLNATAFYYNYKGYQVSQIIQRTSVNSNIDAEVWGAELESLWEPVPKLRFNANVGWLQTRLKDIAVIDLTNLTQSDPNYVTLKNGANFSNCIAPTGDVAKLQALINAGILPATAMLGVCGDAFAPGWAGQGVFGFSIKSSGGIPAQLGGNELPNSPEWTVSLGAQYTWELAGGWRATPRVDFYYQASSFSRIYNQINDRLDSWTNTNVTLVLDKPDWDLSVQVFIRNLTDETAITDQYLTDDSSGLFTNIFLSEPRTYGVSVTKRF
jgi:outer membrane receptor protein involved in Fe transport